MQNKGNNMLRLKELKNTIISDTISKVKGEENTFKFYRGFYYKFQYTAEKFSKFIVEQINSHLGYTATIIDIGEVYKPFRGGATVKGSSHFYAKIKIENIRRIK